MQDLTNAVKSNRKNAKSGTYPYFYAGYAPLTFKYSALIVPDELNLDKRFRCMTLCYFDISCRQNTLLVLKHVCLISKIILFWTIHMIVTIYFTLQCVQSFLFF